MRLADFGYAEQKEEARGDGDFKSKNTSRGSRFYEPPEVRQQGVSKSGDVYQMGLVLYEMLQGFIRSKTALYKNIEKVGEKDHFYSL